jgi:hypothetical protein
MSPLRESIIVALETEITRIEAVKGAWRADAAERHARITEMLDDLRSDRLCFMEIRKEMKPWEIKL